MSMEQWEREIRKATCKHGCGEPDLYHPARMIEGRMRHSGRESPVEILCTYNPALLPIVQAAYAEGERAAVSIKEENARLKSLLNTPEIENFDSAVPLEAAHQVSRWGAPHDDGKTPEDWFWLLGYLAGKALASAKSGDIEKAKHHCISSAAALRNWHAHLRNGFTLMRPGIAEPKSALPVEAAPAMVKQRLRDTFSGHEAALRLVWDKWMELDCDKVLFTQWLSEQLPRSGETGAEQEKP